VLPSPPTLHRPPAHPAYPAPTLHLDSLPYPKSPAQRLSPPAHPAYPAPTLHPCRVAYLPDTDWTTPSLPTLTDPAQTSRQAYPAPRGLCTTRLDRVALPSPSLSPSRPTLHSRSCTSCTIRPSRPPSPSLSPSRPTLHLSHADSSTRSWRRESPPRALLPQPAYPAPAAGQRRRSLPLPTTTQHTPSPPP
jgi:hypothetical protein